MDKEIKTLNDLVEWVEGLELGDHIFRGVSNKGYDIQASTYIRLKDENDKSLERLREINKGLIEEARLLGHDEREGQDDFSDLEMLAQLQHYRAATCLIDFTYSAQVALWFACQPSSKSLSSSAEDPDGKIVAVRNNPHEVKEITSELLKKKLDHFFIQGKDKTYQMFRLFRWQPQQQNNRIIAQQSIFLFGRAEIEVETQRVIPAGCKESLLASLEKVAGITEATLFPDFDGFARLHAYNRRYSVNSVQNYLQRASRAHGRDEFDDAINYYNEAICLEKKESSQEEQEKQKSLLSYLHLRRGWAQSEKDDSLDGAIADYNKAIELDEKNVRAYRSMGHAKYRQKKYKEAIMYYKKAIDMDSKHILTYVRSALAEFESAHLSKAEQNFQKALELAEEAKNNVLKTQIEQLQREISSPRVKHNE